MKPNFLLLLFLAFSALFVSAESASERDRAVCSRIPLTICKSIKRCEIKDKKCVLKDDNANL